MRDGADLFKRSSRPPGSFFREYFSMCPLEAKNNSRRQADVVLPRAEKFGVHVVAFEAPRDRTKQPVVNAAAQRGFKRGVARGGSAGTDVCQAHHEFAEGRDLAHGNTHPRPEQHRILMRGHTYVHWLLRPEHSKALGAVTAAEIGDQPHPWHDFSFERTFPALQVGPARVEGRRRTRIFKRVSK